MAAEAIAGSAVAVLVGRDGSLDWQVVRVAAVVGLTVAAVARSPRQDPRARASLAFGFGLVTTAVGGGIGIPHALKGGSAVAAVAGLAALVAGGFLLVAGGVALARSFRRWRRYAATAGELVVAYVVLFSLGLAVAATNVPRATLDRATPADRGLLYRDVRFPATDGVMLSGWYVPSTNGAAVVVLHGAGSTRSDVLEQTVVLARHGFGVLAFDARGHGRSAGRAMDFGWYGDADTTGAVTFVLAQPDVRDGRVAALGESMGGEEALGAAAADARLRAVVGEGTVNRVAADKQWLSDTYGLRGWLQQRLDGLMYAVTDLLTDAGPPASLRRAAIAMAPRPVLLIAAGRVPDEGRADRTIAAAAPRNVEVWEVPGSGHTGGLRADPAQWESRVIAFLSRALAS